MAFRCASVSLGVDKNTEKHVAKYGAGGDLLSVENLKYISGEMLYQDEITQTTQLQTEYKNLKKQSM